MGKVKRLRKKFHLSREEPEVKDAGNFTVSLKDETIPQDTDTLTPLPNISENNIFAGMDIKFEDLKKDLSFDDSRSVVSVSKREFKNRITSKKERRLARHETFISKINAIQKLKIEEKEKRRRQKRAVIGDLKALVDALPAIECHKNKERKRPAPKKRSVPKLKWRQKNMLHDVASFKRLLHDPSFKKDPSAAVANLIQEKIKQNVENS
ncbi:ribosome biogenesis protein SLX9 homolog [Schistocerca nitens]|uniref:ribosome biogenesis protein SLX9 homolog n=1 Tax=Schistocerca nitens TaxID=7011 RepID=UPI00211773C1|nr:ribosome biogenesis protein SLX9 homolog [Schistocerca nitens]